MRRARILNNPSPFAFGDTYIRKPIANLTLTAANYKRADFGKWNNAYDWFSEVPAIEDERSNIANILL
jgi:hypothetical protein